MGPLEYLHRGTEMKWFKHFTDSNRSQEMLRIKRELGMAGIGCLWNLTESCAGLMEKSRDEKYSETHCQFNFDISYIANIFGCKPGRVPVILKTFQECNQLRFSIEGFIIKIEMPKLLEWLDRDTDRARPKRGQAELRSRVDTDKEIETERPQTSMQYFFDQSDIFRAAVRKFAAGDENIKAYLGEQRWAWWIAIGSSRIRQMPSDESGRKDLAYAIKRVAEKT